MDKISFDLLKQMMEADHKGLVSIYMPTWRVGNETTQSRIQLKNMLKKAEERLIELGYGTREANQILKPAAALSEDTMFWQNQDRTLAIFISPDSFTHYKLPITVDETLVVGNRYYIRPMIKYLSTDSRFNILTLSQAEVRLFEAGPFSIERVDAPSIDELVENYVPAKDLHQESTSPKGAAGGSTSFMHGYNEISQTEKNEISKHLRSIDKEIMKILKDTGNPLVIFSVDYIFPMYREVSSYPHLMEESIKGSPEGVGLKDIHTKAWELVMPRFESLINRELEKFMTLKSTDSKFASTDIAEIAGSAVHGRVDRLFIADGVQQWGHWNKETGEVVANNQEGPEHQDLLDLAAIMSIEKGGKVYVLDKERMPVLKPAGALLRF